MQLTIRNMETSDSGVYYCNAQNTFGTFSQAIKLQARKKSVSLSIFSSIVEIEFSNDAHRIVPKNSYESPLQVFGNVEATKFS